MQRPRGSSSLAGSAGSVLHQQSNGSVFRPQSNALPQRGQRAHFMSASGVAEAVMAARSSGGRFRQ
jgi:hypothetical protein